MANGRFHIERQRFSALVLSVQAMRVHHTRLVVLDALLHRAALFTFYVRALCVSKDCRRLRNLCCIKWLKVNLEGCVACSFNRFLHVT